MNKNYYDILKIDKNASADEIKSAFKKQAMEYHPDRNKASDAETKFKEINQAYGVLGDTNKKKIYDQWAMEQDNGGWEDGYEEDMMSDFSTIHNGFKRKFQSLMEVFLLLLIYEYKSYILKFFIYFFS